MNMMDELKEVMTGKLNCNNDNLQVYINYCNKRIKSMTPFIEEVQRKNITDSSILNIKENFVNKIQQFNKFLDWCKVERNISIN